MPVSVFDVVAYFLEQKGPVSRMHIHRLCYYAQAWHLVWEGGEPLFEEPIYAYISGPVIPELLDWHGMVSKIATYDKGDSENLTLYQRSTIDSIIENYGDIKSRDLAEMSRAEVPWKDARKGLHPTERGGEKREITNEALLNYFSKLYRGKTENTRKVHWVRMNLEGEVKERGIRPFDENLHSLGIMIHPPKLSDVYVEAVQFSEEDCIELAHDFIENNMELLKKWQPTKMEGF